MRSDIYIWSLLSFSINYTPIFVAVEPLYYVKKTLYLNICYMEKNIFLIIKLPWSLLSKSVVLLFPLSASSVCIVDFIFNEC